MSADNDVSPANKPTRAIHESYLEMHRRLKDYRRAKDRGDGGRMQAAHGELQDAVLTLWEELRPHIRAGKTSADYWGGEPPDYHGEWTEPPIEDGVAVLAVQKHTTDVKIPECIREAEEESPPPNVVAEGIGLNGDTRLVGAEIEEHMLIGYCTYQTGLKHLDGWETAQREVQTTLGGFMGDRTVTEQKRQRIGMPKLKRAVRVLGNAAEDLGALSQFDESKPRTEITDEMIEEVEEWRAKNL